MKYVLLLIFISSSIYSQSGWVWQNPLPQGNNLHAIDFVNSNTGYAVGEAGTVIKTTNGGLNWSNVNLAFSGSLRCLDFLNENTGYAATLFATIVKTTNGGLDWITTLNVPNSTILSIFVMDENVVFATGAAVFYKTTNAGTNWFSYPTGYSSGGLYDINFLNADTGFIVGHPNVVLRTTNGGANWVNTVEQSTIQVTYNAIGFSNNNVIITNYQGEILRSTNLGNNWVCGICNTDANFIGLSFNNAGTGLALVSDKSFGPKLYRSINSGQNWTGLSTINTSLYRPGGISLNGNNVVIVGDFGMILRSTNSGLNWAEISDRSNLNLMWDVYYKDINTGFICAGYGNIYKTTNGGNNWILKHSDTIGVSLIRLKFFNDLGISVGNTGRIFRTTNLGENWQRIFVGNESIAYRDFDFIDKSTIVISGGNNLKSTNGGLNWFNINGPTGIRTGIEFINENEGYNTSDGKIYKTIDGGSNWIGPANVTGSYNSISFFDNNTGIAAGTSGYIAKTTDAGISWTTNIISGYNLTKISKVDDNIMFILSPFEVYKTFNSGISWDTINCSNVWGGLFGIHFINQNTGTITGLYGKILKTTTGGEPIGIEPISNEIPKSFNLQQNYPNPFNPATIIKFAIPNYDYVSLKIYDILGREISAIVNENLKAGEYEIRWDASAYPSGVYFYQLTSKNHKETKKMIFIK